jgi:hypothetical protein
MVMPAGASGLWIGIGALGVWVGLRTIAQRRWAILVGLALSLFLLFSAVIPFLGLFGNIGFSITNIVRSASVQLLPVIMHCFALVSFVVNREPQSGGGDGSYDS